VARQAGVPFVGFWLEAPSAVLEQRIAGRRNDASDADAAVLRKQLAIDPGPPDWMPIDAAKGSDTVAATAQSVMSRSIERTAGVSLRPAAP
jgi:hypothetical protein